MELALAAMLWLLAICWLAVRRLRAPDYLAMTDSELIRLHGLQQKRLAAAGVCGSERYEAALRRTGRLRDEMKRRGLIEAGAFVSDPFTRGALELEARQRYSGGVNEVQTLSARGDAAALYQLGVLFRLANENDMASGFIAKAAEAGDASAQFARALALLGAEDEPGPDQQREALTWLRLAAAQGHDQAKLALSGLMRSLPVAVVWPALREARRRMKQTGTRAAGSAATSPAQALAPAVAAQRSFG